MKKVMIIDDEYIILQGLLHMIDWNKYGYQVVFFSQEASPALEYIKNNPVDIIISDIVMPQLNGLELLAKAKELNNGIFVMFVTSHRDFSFAQEAIRLGAADYILKSELSPETLLQSLNSLEIEEKIESTDLMLPLKTELNAYLNKNTPLTNHIKEYFRTDLYQLIFSDIKNKSMIEKNLENLEHVYTIEHEEVLVTMINSTDYKVAISNINDFFYTSPFQKVELIHAYYKAYKEQKDIKFYDSHFICSALALDFTWETIASFCYKKYQTLLNEEKYYHALDYFYQFVLQELAKENIQPMSIKSFASNIIYQFLTNLETKKIIDKESSNLKLDFVNKIHNSYESADFIQNLNAIMAQLSIIIQSSVNLNTFNFKAEIEAYLYENYHNNISLADLAHNFNFSYHYMSELFRSSFNSPFNEILNKIRIDEAKSLLSTTDFPLRRVAEMVGYNNYSHFSSTFSKITHLSPSDYRRLNYERAN